MVLTTITPFWGRPDMLLGWVRAVRAAASLGVQHLVYFVGERPPIWWEHETRKTTISAVICEEAPGKSIGHYHNLGAREAGTEWMMKLDVDTIPNMRYFQELTPVLARAGQKQWFNGGMLYLSQRATHDEMRDDRLPLTAETYRTIMDRARAYTVGLPVPRATNFICRTRDYLKLGGSDPRFTGYGWEDYQQIYMLEKHEIGFDPLLGEVALDDVARRIRDEISRRKARELHGKNSFLCLLHRWHATPVHTESLERNRKILFDYVVTSRRKV